MSLSIKHAPLSDNPEALNLGPYMCVADANLRVISIFDDLKYDRADVDMMSPAMRNHAIARLDPLGFKQVSGTVLKHHASGVCCLILRFMPWAHHRLISRVILLGGSTTFTF